MSFEDIFLLTTNEEWDDSYIPFRKIAEYRYLNDKLDIPEEQDVHDIAVSYYIMYLITTATDNGIGSKTSESLGDYSYSKGASKYDGLNEWLAKYLSFINSFKPQYLNGVKNPPTDPLTHLDTSIRREII